MEPIEIIILSLPIIFVLATGYFKPPFVEKWALKFEAWANKKKEEHRAKKSEEKKWKHHLRHPFMIAAVWLADTSKKHIPDVHWRSAVFLGVTMVLFAVSAFLIFIAVIYAAMFVIALVIAIGVLKVAFKVFLGGGNNEGYTRTNTYSYSNQNEDEEVTDDKKENDTLMMGAAGKGSFVYDDSVFGGNFIGYVNDKGYIYDNSGFGGSYLGRIDDKGYIYKGDTFGDTYIGRVDKDGSIYASATFGDNYVGRIENNSVFDNSAFGGNYKGHIKKQ